MPPVRAHRRRRARAPRARGQACGLGAARPPTLVVAFPYLLLAAVLLLGLARLVKHDHRREIVIGLLSLVGGFNVLGVGVLVASLLSSRLTDHGRQLLLSGGVVLFADAVAFGLAFWELDCGGPRCPSPFDGAAETRLSVSAGREPRAGSGRWSPRLSATFTFHSRIRFRSARLTRCRSPGPQQLMAAESTLSVVTVLLVAARAVNILG